MSISMMERGSRSENIIRMHAFLEVVPYIRTDGKVGL